jgi:HlyD family secretion protein
MTLNRDKLKELKIDRSAPARSSSMLWIAGLVALALMIAAGIFLWTQREKAVPVRTMIVRENSPGSTQTLLNASGYVTPRRQATVSSKVTGKVVEVFIEEGMEVQEGQVLATLDAANVEANLRLAQAQQNASQIALEETQVRLKEAKLDLQRATTLAANQIASEAEMDRARAQYDSLLARLQTQEGETAVARRQVEIWEQQLEDTIIRAPFAGVVVAKNAQPGEMISPISAGGGFTRTGICTIVDMSSLEIEVDVNESFITRVHSGQKVEATLDAYSDWKIPCRVLAIIPTADRQKATVRVRVGFEELDSRILPQMGVKVAFRSEAEANAGARGGEITIPRTALRRQQDQETVLVVRQGRLEERIVQVGSRLQNEVTILSGLAQGEKIVVNGPKTFNPNQLIQETK